MSRLVLLLALGACTPTPTIDTVSDIQRRTYEHCHYTPSAASVRRILAVGNEVLNDPETMSLAICHAQGASK